MINITLVVIVAAAAARLQLPAVLGLQLGG
jgi:hypothetical protein